MKKIIKISFVILGLIICTNLTAQTSKEYNDSGEKAFGEQRYEDAFNLFDKAVKADNSFAIGYGNRGYLYYMFGEYEKALADQNKAIELAPDTAILWINRGLLYIAMGNFNSALSDITKYLSFAPNDGGGYFFRAQAFAGKNLYDKAIVDLNKSIELAPTPEVFDMRGQMYKRLEKFDLAIADFDQALALNPQFTSAILNKAQAMNSVGKTTEAIEIINKAIDAGYFTGNPSGYSLVGNLYGSIGNFTEAVNNFRKCEAAGSKDANMYNNKAACEIELTLLDDALSSINKSLEFEPGVFNSYMTRANIYYRLGKFEAGLLDAEKAVSMEPDNLGALNAKGLFLLDLGRRSEAEAVGKRIEELQNK
ncbi:MAG TPA: hypothetical protein DDX39_01170 [Bacteroidales bacterium]|nr:MAG: hypothetical protein A2W98_07380 [Bacteroidetes bacterium GWF2_33_38]OFY89764.1 MAG: hypothetical protein A2236_10745 [Bacteroidetes bacterium RIFOXYA2_FULL_33_7]HBF87222.1 hypothetical protein [Bacteroidales bacterium]